MLKKLNRVTANCPPPPPTKILQFGEGNFLRAFVDWMVDILNEKTEFNAGIQVIQPIAKGMAKMLNDQDGLYHVILKGLREGKVMTETRLITCVSGCINPYETFDTFLKSAETADLRFIVSNTTEAGIAFNPSDTRPDVLAETFPGKITQLLWHRYTFFHGDEKRGFIFLPCELIDKNGDTLRKAVLQFVELWKLPKEFSDWINNSNIFCNTLVDRIVPGFPKENINEVHQDIGYDDQMVVQAEPFHLWVIEGPPDVEQELPMRAAGLDVKFVADLTPYRTRKVRILNGAHTSLVPVAYLAGFRTVMESINDDAIGGYIRKVIFDEIIPTLDLPAEELHQFANDVIERFKNPFIRHELLSIALNSISKFKVRVLPSVVEYYKRNGSLPENLILSFAALLRFYKGDWKNDTIPLNDSADVLEFFKDIWNNNQIDVSKVLANDSLWGQDLSVLDGLAGRIQADISRLKSEAFPVA